ncbi:MAG: C39 family peptidase [Candidatus Nomurabacteria bacterium]|nr:MAG: C39 family peptidase [Candidatus Nomurabacteria bacterium]
MLKNKYFWGLVLILIIVGSIFFCIGGKTLPSKMVEGEITLYQVAFSGEVADRAYIDVPFRVASEAVRHLNIGIDFNGDGVITPSDDNSNEWVVRNVVPIISAGEHLRFLIELKGNEIKESDKTEVVFFYSKAPLPAAAVQYGESDIKFTSERARITSVQVDNMQTSLYVDEENNKRTGPSVIDANEKVVADDFSLINTANSQTDRPDYYNASHDGVPDQDQEYNECSPTSVANSFTWLAKEYGFEDLMPEDIGSTIDELKADLDWDSGTNDEDIIPGKQMFVDRHNLPIEVHQIGLQNDQDIHYQIYEELKKGQAVEVSLQFYKRDENGNKKKAGGHMVTVTGVSGGPDFKGIRFNDPATEHAESGSGELYELKGNKLKGFWTDKEVEIEYAYAQSPITSVTDGTWVMPSGKAFLVGQDHVLNAGGDVVAKGISRFGFFNSFIDHPGDHYVGDRFTVVATVVMRNGERQYMFYTDEDGKSQAYWHAAKGPWTLDGVITGGGPISPGRLVGRPTVTTVNGDRYRLEQTYQCVEPGLAKVTYEANVTWTVEDSGQLPPDMAKRYEDQLKPEATFKINSPIFQCLTQDVGLIDEPTGLSLPEPKPVCEGVEENPEGKEIEVLKLGKECYPKVQFHVGGAMDPCQAEHWHAGGKVFSLLGTETEDPNPNACGFGKLSEVKVEKIKISPDTAAKFLGGVLDDAHSSHDEGEVEYTDFNYNGYSDGFDYKVNGNIEYGGYDVEVKGN